MLSITTQYNTPKLYTDLPDNSHCWTFKGMEVYSNIDRLRNKPRGYFVWLRIIHISKRGPYRKGCDHSGTCITQPYSKDNLRTKHLQFELITSSTSATLTMGS